MSEAVSREEMNARLEAAEARTETRFVQLIGKIDAIGGQVAQLREEVGGQLAEVRADLGGQMAGVLADNKSTRQTIMWVTITAMLTVIAVVIAVQVGLMNAFSAGAARRESVPAAAAASTPPMGPASLALPHSSQAPAPAGANTSG